LAPGCIRVPPFEPTVILVDDDPDVLDAAVLLLETEGLRVWGTPELDAAHALVCKAPGAVVLLDLSLPGDVAGFIRALHAIDGWSGQVLLFSAGDRLDERAAELGADGSVPKPFDVERLVRELHQRLSEPHSVSPPPG